MVISEEKDAADDESAYEDLVEAPEVGVSNPLVVFRRFIFVGRGDVPVVNACGWVGVPGGEFEGVERSDLLPTRRTVRFSDARARASLRNVGREVKVWRRVMSYIRRAPAAPR